MEYRNELIADLRKKLLEKCVEETWKTDSVTILHVLKVLFHRLHQAANLAAPVADPWPQIVRLRIQLAGSERCFQSLIQAFPDKYFTTLYQLRLEVTTLISLEDWETSIDEAEDFCSLPTTQLTLPKQDTTTLYTAAVTQLDAAVSNMVSVLSLEDEILSLRNLLKISPRHIGETYTYTWKRDLATGLSYSSKIDSTPHLNLFCNLALSRWDPEDGRLKMQLATKGLLPRWLEKLILLHTIQSHQKSIWHPCEKDSSDQPQKSYSKPPKRLQTSGGFYGPRPYRRF